MDLQITYSLLCYKTQEYYLLINYSSFLPLVFWSQTNIFVDAFVAFLVKMQLTKKMQDY